jgi:lysine 6-dehydrogenase
MKVIILGAGLVGGPIAMDLAADSNFKVHLADISEIRLEAIESKFPIQKIEQDLSDIVSLKQLVKNYDYVINAVPGFMGYQTVKAIIEAGINLIDIAFMPEDAFELDQLAKDKGVSAIVDCGVAPGMSNLLMGYAHNLLDETVTGTIYVGGLPKKRVLPWEYKAVFSPVDVIEEYTRPARLVENFKEIIKPALTESEFIDFPSVGTLEAFNTDGLRSLIYTIKARHLKEKTLRFPGYIDKIKVLKESGFFDEEEVIINGNKIKPIDFTSQVLFPKWKLEDGDADFTVMQITADGIKAGKKMLYQYDLYDEYDDESGIHSMARTTGYTASSVLRLIQRGYKPADGVIFPELLGSDHTFVKNLLKELETKGIEYKETISNDTD